MRLIFSFLFVAFLSTVHSQTNGTIRIEKENILGHPIARFAGLESGPVVLRNFMIDKCLEANIGIIEHFEMVAEDKNGNWIWIKCDTSCFSGENYKQLQGLGNGTQIEFMNIIGLNDQGTKIIYPGMKFVISKKL